jgi:acyl-CoA hydrolase
VGAAKPTPRASRTSVVLSQVMQPADANHLGNIHGGVIMKLIDEAAGTCAYQFARMSVVTAAIDRIDFHYPVHIGNLVVLKASINHAGSTSIEVGVRVEAEDLNTGEITHTNSAYLVFVALDEHGRPTKVPQFVPATAGQRRRQAQAAERRRLRLAAREPRD